MIQLELLDGSSATVNAANITYFQPSNGQTLIFFIGGAMLYVKESYEAVVETFRPAQQIVEAR
jgi:uncharacterized protein YlzI (FlbEa/FlbD family)